ncbi:MAG: hypothetical protein ABW110_03965 [Steroidobacteraceae bacterium]
MQSIHYRAAQRAFQQGQTEREFAEAAQRHEKAFWLCVLAAAMLWWLANWQWAVLAMMVAARFGYCSFAEKRIQRHIANCKHPAPKHVMDVGGAEAQRTQERSLH